MGTRETLQLRQIARAVRRQKGIGLSDSQIIRAVAGLIRRAFELGAFQAGPFVDFLAEFTQHIPPKGGHLVRYYGWYSNKARGMRKKAAAAAAKASGQAVPAQPATSPASQTWAMLIKRVYELDPLECPKCGGTMKVIAFIEPPQGEVIERILRHCALWQSPRPPPDGKVAVHVHDDAGARELAFVAEPDWEGQPSSGDVPWEVTSDAYGDPLDASF